MQPSSTINPSRLQRLVKRPSIAPVWPVIASTFLLTIGLGLPWMQLYHPSFRGQSPFLRAAGGVIDSPIWLLFGLSMILLGLVRIRYRALWLVLLSLVSTIHLWFAYDALRAWMYLNGLEQALPLERRAPTASAGIGLYLSGIAIVLTFLSVFRYRRSLSS